MYLLTHPDVCVNAVGEKRGQETCESLLQKITPETVSNIQMLYVLEKKKTKRYLKTVVDFCIRVDNPQDSSTK